MPDLTFLVEKLAVWALPVLLAVTVHEAAHGYVARHFGDDTAERAGRLSLNPFRHVDAMGTVLVPALMLWLGGFLFGWAKPVPVDFSRLRRPLHDMAFVAAAGPASNAVMMLIWALGLTLLQHYFGGEQAWPILCDMAIAGISINIALMVLNLLPLLPLDGGRILLALLPLRLARPYAQLERWGLPILLLLVFTGALGTVLFWPMALVEVLVYTLFSIHVS